MMEGYPLVALLMLIGIALLIAEMLLPSHGLLGLGAAACILTAVFVAMRQNAWAGLGLLLVVVAMSPLAWTAFVKIWPKTPLGRRIVLPPVANPPTVPPVTVGQSGVTMSELRPVGVCEFDGGVRVEAHSEHGIVPPGTAVKVIALVNNRPMVRVA
jgi:membrane-bound ClpP family serine protease